MRVVKTMSSKHEVTVTDDAGIADAVVVEVQDAADLRSIAILVDRLADDEADLRAAVAQARTNGKSWGQIGVALGVSRQAAHERFSPQ